MIAASVMAVAALYLARDVLIPITLAILFAFLLNPLVARLRARGVPHIPSVLVVCTAALIFLGGLAAFITMQMADVMENLPEYSRRIQDKLQPIVAPIEAYLGRASDSVEELTNGTASQPATPLAGPPADPEPAAPPPAAPAAPPRRSFISTATALIPAFLAPIGLFAIVTVLTGAMLIQGADLRDRVVRLIGDRRVSVTTQALDDVAERVGRYLLVQTMLNGSLGAVIAIGLALLGVPNAVLWGVLWALLRFLPYVGPWLGALFPLITAMSYFDTWTPVLATGALLIVVELTCNTILEPWLYGSGTGLSPLAVIVSAVFWAWLWGWTGLFLATPMTVCLAVLGRYVEPLSYLHVLLGDKPVLRPGVRLYQRLLTGQFLEARDLVNEEAKNRSRAELFERVMIPALAQVERDRNAGHIDDAKVAQIHETVRRLIDELPETAKATTVAKTQIHCLCLPVRGEADELCGRMLASVASAHGVQIEMVESGYLLNEKVQLVADRIPHVVLLSAMSTRRIPFLRHTLQRLLQRAPDVNLVAGVWYADERGASELELGNDSPTIFVTTFDQALDAIRYGVSPSKPASTTSAPRRPSDSADPGIEHHEENHEEEGVSVS